MNKDYDFDDFIKIAYERGKVRDVEDAFDEYPVNEEWHEGKIENVLNEDESLYGDYYDIGDIVFVKKYKYMNGNEGSNHFFVIIENDNLAIPIEYFGMLISSQLQKLKYSSNKLLEKNKENNLKSNSIVKTDIIYKISNDQILFKLGSVDLERVYEYKESFLKNK